MDDLAKDARALHTELDALLARELEPRALREALERLLSRRAMPFVFHRLVRPLLERDALLFLPLVRPRFEAWGFDRKGRLQRVWADDRGQADLDWVIRLAEMRDDVPLFQAAMRLRLWSHGGKYAERFRSELMARFTRAGRGHARVAVLAQFAGLFGSLDDETAIALWKAEPATAKRFILGHLPFRSWNDPDADVLPGLRAQVASADPAFHDELYQRLVGAKTWRDDVARIVETVPDEALIDALERHHPRRIVPKAAETYAKLLTARGPVALPYVHRHVDQVLRGGVWRSRGYRELLRLADAEGYGWLWANILKTAARPEEYNAEVRRAAEDTAHPSTSRHRLDRLAGTGRELNLGGYGIAHVRALDDETACALYERDPRLLLGPYKRHLYVGVQGYPKLVARLLQDRHEELLDFVASRLVTRSRGVFARAPGGLFGRREAAPESVADTLSRHYEALRDAPAVFADRAASVLGQVPPYTVFDYDTLLESNRLARLLYEHAAEDYLASGPAIRDLLEAPEIHAQAIAFRALSLDDARARQLAAANLDLLGATLLRPLRRRTRLLALRALQNAGHTLPDAARVLDQAREALHLPDLRYPKEELVGLIGALLHRHPALRGPTEVPVVYRSAS